MQKNLIKILGLIIGFIGIISCGGGGGDDPPAPTAPTQVNRAPTAPTLSQPTNNLLCIDNVLNFSWNASSDPDGDAISYEIQIATNNQFSQDLQSFTAGSTSHQVTLSKGVAYYWRVKATDSKNSSSAYSSTYQFYTEGEGTTNHLPFSPSISKPGLNSLVQEATTSLEWTASDVDNDDLTYDVYFGTTNPPVTKVTENQSGTSFTVNLEAAKNYYWIVVAKDGNGGQTTGQVWSFKTD